MNRILIILYYTFKPVIPRSLQLQLRRWIARYQRRKYAHQWPIDVNASVVPSGWGGWPKGKHFALVLSHDVDTLKGYQSVSQLAAIEEKMGFRSAFNFVPERYGPISLSLLEELKARGFGIGVHGLKHDGKLFFSKDEFDRRAKRINGYLKDWKSRGFSSPSMHHNLDWMAGLNIDYSSSTFDTDPFEPQPDGMGTIFPLWVSNGSPKKGYVELPYTLPQDSTLFIILREKTIAIWKHKLDWIAQNGGMAFLNTHSDYMCFGMPNKCYGQYPPDYYLSFLDYVRKRYSGLYWNALPGEVAHFWKTNMFLNRSKNAGITGNTKEIDNGFG